MRRGKMPYKKSRRVFSKTAAHVNGRNLMATPMRGGYRL